MVGYTSAGVVSFVSTAGTSEFESGEDIAIDSAGRLLATGSFGATADFDPGAGTQNLTSFGEDDAFVWKLTTAGAYLDAYQLGGDGEDKGNGVAVFGTDVMTTGGFSGDADFDPDGDVEVLSAVGSQDAFLSRVDMP